MSSLQKLVHAKGLPPKPQHPAAFTGNSSQNNARKRDYSAKPWDEFFESQKQIVIANNKFQYYESGAHSDEVLVLFLHGGGFSGLSWAVLTKKLSSLVDCHFIALDFRGHGGTVTEDENDMSAETLAKDICLFLEVLEIDLPVVLIGHSMGGAIAIHTANTNRLPRLAGLVVIDVVEGTALEALKSMHHVLHNRPSSFESIEKANEWCVRSGYIRNLESARVSMPGQLVRKEIGASEAPPSNTFSIAEEPDHRPSVNTSAPNSRYVWRIDLLSTEPYWEGWFKGMSALFLSVPTPKVLLLAGVDRLDKELSIGQMQGKFQLQVMQRSGHAVHEDNPDAVAEVISTFLLRHKLTRRR